MIPPPLRDRLEILNFSGYSDKERYEIAKRFLVPKMAKEHGLEGTVTFTRDAIECLVRDYTRESGVRELERKIAAVCRKSARRIIDGAADRVEVDRDLVNRFLGRPKISSGPILRTDEVGAATGLMVAEHGGEIVRVEASLMSPQAEKPELRLTGRLGDVMKESAEAALTFVRTSAERLNLGRPFRFDVHVHVPDAGVPKDGPSAGLTIAIALVSAATGRAVRRDVAMTGEITLRGTVLPVGGVREKLLAAARGGMQIAIIPEGNAADVEDINPSELGQLEVRFVGHLDEALALALKKEGAALAWI
jgi:ATP-dependent Lon protease